MQFYKIQFARVYSAVHETYPIFHRLVFDYLSQAHHNLRVSGQDS